MSNNNNNVNNNNNNNNYNSNNNNNNNNNDNNILIHWIKLQIVSSGDTLWPYEAAISEKRTNSSHSF